MHQQLKTLLWSTSDSYVNIVTEIGKHGQVIENRLEATDGDYKTIEVQIQDFEEFVENVKHHHATIAKLSMGQGLS
jgi:hypothetical protein